MNSHNARAAVGHQSSTNADSSNTPFFLSGFATFHIAVTAFVGLVFLLYCLTAASMTGPEEANLIEKSGEEYREYREHARRFLPRLY